SAERIFTNDDLQFIQGVANILASAVSRFEIEEELSVSRNQLDVILKSVADGITVQGKNGELVYANTAAALVNGFSSVEEFMRTPVSEVVNRFDIFDEEGKPFQYDQLPGRMVLNGKEEAFTIIRFRNKVTQEERWSVVKARPIYDEDGEVEMAVNVFQDITELKRIAKKQKLLAEAGDVLAESMDYEKTLNSIASLAVRDLADWCEVDVVGDDNVIHQVAITHKDPVKVDLARELRRRYPTDWNNPEGLPEVIRTGKPKLYPLFTDRMLVESARDKEHLRIIRELGLMAAIIMPLVARGRTIGAITLVWAESGHGYNPQDLEFAKELAQRAAIALDNARLFKDAQQLNIDLEQRVNQRTHQLQSLISKLRTEIGERKKAEEALRENEAMLENLFESAPDATIITDQDGKIVRLNAQTEDLFGFQREELIGKPIDILLPARYRNRHASLRMEYEQEPQTRSMGAGLHLYGLRKNGSEFPIDIMLSPVNRKDGLLVITAVRDITERKQMEAELAEVQRRLIDSLEKERLILAQELHDSAIQDLYGISYQLKALEDALDPANEKDHFFKENLEPMKEMTQQVINLLRNICGDLRPPALAPFGLEKAIKGHIEKVSETHPEITIELNLAPDGQTLPEHIRLALYRIYQHAVSNVIRHSGAKRLEIRFMLDEQKVTLEVQDNGCGFKVPKKWVELVRGGHMGLVGTAERAEALGGQLRIESNPGSGTLIQVTVPRESSTAAQSSNTISGSTIESTPYSYTI
ncbi:MAG: PAS domain S-box protein, partial [Omnitrophica WOR_2 bacterium]